MYIWVLSILFFSTILIVGFSLYLGISPMPSSRKAKSIILSLVITNLQGKIVELGAGFGTLAIGLSKKCPKCTVEAYELSPIPYLFLKMRSLFYPNLKVIRKDFFKIKLEEVRGVIVYLYPKAMERLKIKLAEELEPGSFIISNTFAIPEWPCERSVEVDDLYRSKVFFYFKNI